MLDGFYYFNNNSLAIRPAQEGHRSLPTFVLAPRGDVVGKGDAQRIVTIQQSAGACGENRTAHCRINKKSHPVAGMAYR